MIGQLSKDRSAAWNRQLWCSGQTVNGSHLVLSVSIFNATLLLLSSQPPLQQDGEADLHHILHRLMENLPEDGWRFVSANAPVLDQSTGTALLAAKMILTYSNTEQEAS